MNHNTLMQYIEQKTIIALQSLCFRQYLDKKVGTSCPELSTRQLDQLERRTCDSAKAFLEHLKVKILKIEPFCHDSPNAQITALHQTLFVEMLINILS